MTPEDRIKTTKNTFYNLENDIGETSDVASANLRVVAHLLEWTHKDNGDVGICKKMHVRWGHSLTLHHYELVDLG